MQTFLRLDRTIDAQLVAPFTGEGAYHGSTKRRPQPAAPPPVVEEVRPRTAEALARSGERHIATFQATFPNRCELVESLAVPSPDEVVADAVTLCWCPLDCALREAGPLTRRVLGAMVPHLTRSKRHVYVDSKIQYFRVGELPVDSTLWHVDGSIVARGALAERLGHPLLHDMKARLSGGPPSPQYLSWLSSPGCQTQLATSPVTIELPSLIPRFDVLDRRVRQAQPDVIAQPPGAIVRFDGGSLHRAVAAGRDGWRLWIRCVETDREVRLSRSIIECYNTVFQPPLR